MSRLNMSLVRSAAIGAAVAFFCGLGVAAEQSSDSANTQTTIDSTGLSWQPTVSYKSATLTVSGPGELNLRREFAAGEALVFHVNDPNQAALEDGQYAWEIRFSPAIEPTVKKALLSARESGNTSEIEALKKQGKLPAGPLVVSGYFRVKGGSIVVYKAEPSVRRGGARLEPSGSQGAVDTDSGVLTKDQVILDDLIVDGSICAGMDCVNGESFGFDTIRIKENNLRIRAVDTSSTSSFPSRDWQITFNDSANGGANKFSIDDIDGGRTPFTLEAGAPSHSLYVDDGGRLGLGTSTPVVDIHVKSGNTPTLRLEQDGSSGFAPQTWDVAGNEAGFFVRDATNGSALPFRILPGAASSTLVITGDEKVGIGVGTSPDEKLHISDNSATTKLKMTNAQSTEREWAFAVSSSDEFRISKQGSGGPELVIEGDGTVNMGPGGDTIYSLTPSGDIIISGTLTENGTPDYVFEESYSLMTLEQLDKFIESNGHLPNIPSAKEVATEGLSSTSFQFKLLEKIEELTLYTLEQQETIRRLQDRLAILEEANE